MYSIEVKERNMNKYFGNTKAIANKTKLSDLFIGWGERAGIILVLFFFAVTYSIAQTHIRTNTKFQNTTATTITCTFAAASTTGNLIVVHLDWSGQSRSISTVTDNKGNSYTRINGPTNWDGTNYRAELWYSYNITGGVGAITVTATLSGAPISFSQIYISEYSGIINTSDPLDQNSVAIGNTAAVSSGSKTTTMTNELIYGASIGASGTINVGAGFTFRSTANQNIIEDKNVTTTGSYNSAFTCAGGNWVAQMATFIAASQPISTGIINGSPFCKGTNVSVPYTKIGIFNAGNVFTAQLSDASGSFAAPVAIGTLTSTAAGTISGTIPIGTSAGTLYRIRVVSSNPARTGTDNGSNLTVSSDNTVTRTSAAATTAQTVCINTPITNITYSTTGATGATVTNLPTGVTGVWAANVVTISGTPTVAGAALTYTVTLTGGCGVISTTGTIAVTANNTVTRTSAAATTAQTVCINTPITNITYSTTGATGATVTNLPTGVTGVWAANVVTISGTPTASGTFNYIVTLTGGCGTITANGTITVTALPVATFSYTSTPYCINGANPSPTFSGGGVAGTFSSTAGLVFVSTATGQVNLVASTPGSYTVTNSIAASGGCGIVTSTSLITIISDLIWTGTVSTDWNEPGNWSCGFIPNVTTNVQIPNVVNKPVLSSGAIGTANNIIIDNSSSLTIVSNTIQISGTITNNGTFTAASGTIEMKGSVAQLIGANVFASNTIKDLIINNPLGVTLLGALNIIGIVTAQNGDLSSSGNLNLVSTATQTALIDGSGTGQVLGNVTMQRYLPVGFGYKYFSSPFQGATVNEFGDDMNLAASFPTFYEYDESRTSAGWVSYTNPASVISPLHGYAVNFGSSVAAKTVDVTGVVNNGPLSRTLNNNNNPYTLGFNLAGNPYPSPIDWDATAGWTKTNIDDALYYFKASGDEYSGTYGAYVNGISSDGKATNIIPSMQGFFVHVSNGVFPVTGTLAMDNRVRITDHTHSFLKSAGKNTIPLLRLIAGFSGDTTSYDPLAIYFDEKATAEFESRLDAYKLMNTTPLRPNLYSIIPGGDNLAINALPLMQDSLLIVPIGLKIAKNGSITFRITDISNLPSETNIFLHDEVKGTDQVLNLHKEYNIYLAAGEYNNRFSLRFVKGTTDIPESRPGTDLLNMYNSKGSLIADIKGLSGNKGTIIINNIAGQIVFRKEIYEAGYHDFNPQLINGMYIVNFITGNIRDTKKIVILN